VDTKQHRKRLLIIGGVAGGASCATRARRLCEQCEIIIFDRGPYVSFANCGLPYFVGDVIHMEESLLVATPDLFKSRFNIDVRLETEVMSIDPKRKTIQVRDIKSGATTAEPYDALVISTGAQPVKPLIPGIDLPGIHVLRTIPDSRKIRAAVEGAEHATVVGGGMIGLEMAENFSHRNLRVSLVELGTHVLPVFDPEMAVYAEDCLRGAGVELLLGQGVESFAQTPKGRITVRTSKGSEIETDVVVLGIGVTPNSALAKDAGLALTPRGAIQVDAFMQTSDPAIFAVGDVVASEDIVTEAKEPLPLAGPANRQGRIAASSILLRFEGEACSQRQPMPFRGIQGTAICGFFGLTVATTGATEKALVRAGIKNYEKIYLHPGNHASYFPDAKPIHFKLLFSLEDGRILGAQAVGEADVARRIDVIAMAIQMKASVFDLEEAELCYAPQFGAAKDPVNMCGMIASNVMRGDLSIAPWSAVLEGSHLVVDVRSEAEFNGGHVAGAMNIPLEELRNRINEIPKGLDCLLICGVGQRAYYANRILQQSGRVTHILSGGMQTHKILQQLT
jgi:NADPH-dependent 2,4-dienoyl-CoA reductase/sulfur reductase-like enzyme/rhodanese-related sulfurtransferase